MEKLKGKLTISRWTGGDGDGVTIELEDVNSNIRILEIDCDVQTFGRMIFGLAYQPVEYQLRGIEHAGKLQERKPLEFRMPNCDYKERGELAAFHAAKHVEDGWIPHIYFGSQNSFERDGDEIVCRTHQYRFVEPTEAQP